MNRRTILLGATALGLAAFAGGATLLTRNRKAEAEAIAQASPPVSRPLLIRDHSPSFGADGAKVTLVEFFDPSCEACRAFHPVVQDILKQFPEVVRVVLRYTPFHEGSDEAIRILETARIQDKFEPVLDALFEKQPQWASHGNPNLDIAWQVAAQAGLDIERAKQDKLLPDITAVLNQDIADVQALGIQQTPTFFLNDKQIIDLGLDSLFATVSLAVQQS